MAVDKTKAAVHLSKYDELETKFIEERAVLEAKYQKLYAPLYSKRHDIMNGVKVDGDVNETAMDVRDDTAKEDKGVPSFWLDAMMNNDMLWPEISERDEVTLKYLKDIKWCPIDVHKSFKLEFFFDMNPFFENSILTKVYHMTDYDENLLEKVIGTGIKFLPEECLTQKRFHGVSKENPLTPLIERLGLPLYDTSGDNSVLYDHDLERQVG